MIGLIKKDIILIIKKISFIYLIAVLVPIIPIFQNPSYLMIIASLIISLLLAAQISVTLSLDETANWNKSVSAMPITGKEEVGSKYILSFFLSLLSAILIFIVGVSAYNIAKLTSQIIVMYVVLGFCVGILYNSILIPATLKFGTEKCRFVLFIFIFIPIILNLGLHALKIQINLNLLPFNFYQILLILLLLIILLMFISFLISVRIQNTKYKVTSKIK